MIFGIELFTISFIAPALTAGAISSERERQTYDLLRTTLLSARSLVLGKLASSLSYIVLLLSAALPLQSLAFLFGGVTVEEVLIGNLLLVITAITLSAVGLLFSSFTKHTLVSTILAYALTTILVLGLPIFLLIAIALFDSVLFRTGFPSNVFAVAFLILGSWFIISLNPIATAVVSEMILIEEQSAFYLAFPIGSGNTIQIISPWISFVIIYLLLSTLMVCFSIHFVNQIEK